jgi:hypothetical protein
MWDESALPQEPTPAGSSPAFDGGIVPYFTYDYTTILPKKSSLFSSQIDVFHDNIVNFPGSRGLNLPERSLQYNTTSERLILHFDYI